MTKISTFIIFLFWVLCIVNGSTIQAQALSDTTVYHSHLPKCGSDILLNHKELLQKRKVLDERLLKKSLKTLEDGEDTNPYNLPVVFHIVHEGGMENIPDQNVYDALKLLNEAFANVAPFHSPTGATTNISFCMAAAGSISRHVSPLTNVVMENDDIELKKLGVLDPKSYINIWVVKSITSLTMGPSVAGYAMLPYTHGAPFDGIVIEADFVANNVDGVKVLVHEMGHYLGLYHTFEGGCKNDNCITDGDRVCDTPPDQSVVPVSCHSSVNTCTSDEDDSSVNNPFRAVSLGGLGDQPDMHQNYMDYGFQMCQTMFTEGQKKRMRDAIAEVRNSLLNNPTACTVCANPVIADIDFPDVLPAGVPFTLQINQTGVNAIWLIGDLWIQVGNSVTTTVPMASEIQVRVIVLGAPGCGKELTHTIRFECPVPVPVIEADSDGLVNSGETVHFTTDNKGYTYTWKTDGANPGTTGASFTYTLPDNFGKLITLTASNGTCEVQSAPYYLDPGNCRLNKENNVWYFGSAAGIDFNFNPPKAIMGKVSTEEGCAVLCDTDGKPLFHSNGESVGNSQTGLVLLNGSGLSGSFTTTQSTLFVPKPGDDRYVYLFTVAAQAGEVTSYNGIYYSIIDKQGDGGKGEVTVKNQLLLGPVVEKVTAVKNFKGDGIWVIAHQWNSNAFYAWEIKSTGISVPVISNVGIVHDSPNSSVMAYSLGELKASPSGKRLALAIQGRSLYEVFDFNSTTGKISNPITLQKTELTANAYGVSFSPNERYLYGAAIGPLRIIRFDLHAGNQEAILNSVKLIGTSSISGGSIQLAPDGRLYASSRQSNYLTVIHNPNAENIADCGYAPESFKLFEHTNAFYGLPNPVQSIFNTVKPVIYGTNKVCLPLAKDTLVQYKVDVYGKASYQWIHKGPNGIQSVSDTMATLRFNVPGVDTLIIKRTALCNDIYDTLFIRSGFPQAVSIGPDVLVCKGTLVNLDAGTGFESYRWSKGATMWTSGARTQTLSVTENGKVMVEVMTNAGCIARDTMEIRNYTLPELNLGRDTSLCTGESLVLQAPAGVDSYQWSTGAITSSIAVQDSGSYRVAVTKFGCTFRDTIHVWKNIPENLLSADTLVRCLTNFNDTILVAPDGFDSYQWSDPSGETVYKRSIEASEDGFYVLTYNNRCGTAKDSIYFYEPKLVPLNTYVTCDDTIQLTSTGTLLGVNALANTPYNGFKQEGNEIEILGSGSYLLLGEYPVSQNPQCIVRNVIRVMLDTALVRPAKSVNLGPDISYCEGNVLPLNAGSGFDSYRWNTGSRDSFITAYGFGAYYVDARYCGFTYTDTIRITRDNSLSTNIGPDKTQCGGESYVLDPGPDFDWYQWSNGETTQQITVSQPGSYSLAAALNGCIVRDTIVVVNGSVVLTVDGDEIICPGASVLLSTEYHEGYTYVWDSTGTETAGLGNTLWINKPGVYKVRNTNCTVWSDPLIVQEEIITVPQFHFYPDSICPGATIEVSFDASAYSDFVWQDGSKNNTRSFASTSVPVLSVKGASCEANYPVALPVREHCDGGTGNPAECQEVVFYLSPNPGKETVTLDSECPVAVTEKIKVSVIVVNGDFLAEKEGTLAEVNEFLRRLMYEISDAVYVMEVEYKRSRQHLKWLVLR